MRTKTFTLAALAGAGALTLAACSTDAADGTSSDDAALSVAASFYPLEFVASAVGGDLISIVSLTPPGVEAHDVELSPSTVRELGNADLALYLSDFQPAVDDAIDTTGVDSLDAASTVALHEADERSEGETEEEHAEHADEDEHSEDEHDHGSSDPHFWLDPTLLADFGDAVGEAFATADPANADTYTANAATLRSELEALDTSFNDGLAQCERDTIVTSHEAFGYLADAYGLHQEGIAGLDPESEPSPARILEIQDIIAETGATTIFTESAVSSSVAEALASDTGVDTAVLDPVENVADGDDYIAVMTRNLSALQAALGCA
ncbi:metal ABC transporter substrate-binding protein [Demequina zhanjiangensis]|uniref:Metal ABC transporter substrate-binding protein n=1 Tax=Demequina zhanjiangensis TaxID=3051659 RepID=A0ABT8G064_9MICO|nr:metal ABC transporter substrate-binding protein [Demequina sp. SYSU T00b26]MDN4472523.1 metal ABC transporter substrate-binding protein [Demequina sp. SYSU T00b26]